MRPKARVHVVWVSALLAGGGACSTNEAPAVGSGRASDGTTASSDAPPRDPTEVSSSHSSPQSNVEANRTGSSDPSPTSPITDDTGATSFSDVTTTEVCPKQRSIPEAANASTTFSFEVVSGDAPLELGAETLSEDGTPYDVTLLGLLLSNPQLETTDGALVEATLVDAAGAPSPYGVFYFHSDNPPAQLTLRAPAGSYQALHFHLGAPDACLGGVHEAPLNADSEMYWTWGASFMAIRFEGHVDEADAGALAFAYHLGPINGVPLVTSDVRVPGNWVLSEEGQTAPTLQLDLARALAPKPEGTTLAGNPLVADWFITNLVDRAFSLQQ